MRGITIDVGAARPPSRGSKPAAFVRKTVQQEVNCIIEEASGDEFGERRLAGAVPGVERLSRAPG
jgi:hypothetical protein